MLILANINQTVKHYMEQCTGLWYLLHMRKCLKITLIVTISAGARGLYVCVFEGFICMCMQVRSKVSWTC